MKINIYLVVILILCGCGKKELTKDSEALLEAAAQEKISGTEQEAAEVNGAPRDSMVQTPLSLTKPVEKSAPNVKKSKLEKLKQGEYLVIKFHQNDTEVELVLDPQ